MDQTSPLAVAPAVAAQMLGIGRTSLYSLIQQGELPALKLGARTLLRVTDLQAWLDRQVDAAR